MAEPLRRILDIAEGQWGLITRQQADRAGVRWTSLVRLVDGGTLERVAHGVYRVRGAGEPDHLGLRAAWLQLDPGRPAWSRLDDPVGAVVSHTSAASLYGVGDLRSDIHEFTLSIRKQTRRADVRLHRGNVGPEDRIVLHGLPTTRASRMIADLLSDHVEVAAVAQITTEVLDRVFDYPSEVVDHLSPYASRIGLSVGDGAGALQHLLRLAGGGEQERVVQDAHNA